MSLDLKTTIQPDAEHSPQQKKLNRLIEQIEQQKIQLEMWQKAKDEIQQYTQKTFMPVYTELHQVLFGQLEQLWSGLSNYELSKADATQLDDKIYALAKMLKDSKLLNQQQLKKVDELYSYYLQSAEYMQNKKSKKKKISDAEDFFDGKTYTDETEFDDVEEWSTESYHQARAQAKLKRQQEEQAQAEKLTTQSLKTVYLKIASIIHPDREQDESKKIEKTELLQQANTAYEQQDLFYLLKLQIQIEQNQSVSKKGLTADQVKFYQLALDAQSQKLQSEIDDLIDTLVWSENAKITVKKLKGKFQISDLYKQIDADTSALKQQVKWEKGRLKYMGKLKGVEMLLEHGVL